MLLALVSCNGIYDDPKEMSAANGGGQSFAYLDARSYKEWHFIDLKTKAVTTLHYSDSLSLPADWDIALHRYDVRTNGSAAIETAYSNLEELRMAARNGTYRMPPDTAWQKDTWDSIIVDMSTMQQGYLTSAPARINKVLCNWLNVNLGSMPPTYTPSGRVYLVRLNGGAVAALRFVGYANPNEHNAKGYISFNYIYPLELNED
ncbi:MAG: HmuY family protein [Bacteroidales bacterium]|nr:HmuY family protein [Bacteroidales bacterium]